MGFARRIIAFFVGIIIGVVSIFTGLAIAGSVFKVKDVTAVVNKGDVVSDELGNETVLSLLLKMMNGDGVIGDMNTLGDVAANVPEVATRVNKILEDDEYKSYAALLGVETFNDVAAWNLADLANTAIEAVKQNANIEKALVAFKMDAKDFDIPFLYESKYVAINAISENDKSEGFDPQAILDKLSEKAPKGLYYKSGDTFVRAYEDDGKIKNEAKNRILYFDFNEITRVCVDNLMPVISALLKNDDGQINFDLVTFDVLKDLANLDLLGSNNVLAALFDGDTPFSFATDVTRLTKLLDTKNFGLLYGKIDSNEDSIINRAIKALENKKIGAVLRSGGIDEILSGITFAQIKDVLSMENDLLNSVLDKLGDIELSNVLNSSDGGVGLILDKLTTKDIAEILNLGEDDMITKILTADAFKDKSLKELTGKDEDGNLGLISALDGYYLQDLVELLSLKDDDIIKKVADKLDGISIGSLLKNGEDSGLNEALKKLTPKDVADILDFGEDNIITKALNKSGDVSLYDILNNNDDGVQRLLNSFKLKDLPDIIGLKDDDALTKALAYAGDTTVGDVLDTKKYVWNEDGTKVESDAEGAETGITHLLGYYQLTYIPEILGMTSEDDILYRALNGKTTTLKEIVTDKEGMTTLLNSFTFDDVANVVNLKDTMIDRALRGKTNLTLDLFVADGGLTTILDDYKFSDMPEIIFGLDEEGKVKDDGIITQFFGLGKEDLRLSVLLDADFVDKVLNNYTLDDLSKLLFPDGGDNPFNHALKGRDITLKQVVDGGADVLLDEYSLDDVARILYGKGDDLHIEKENIITRAFIGKTDFFVNDVIKGVDDEDGNHTDGITAFLRLFRLNEVNAILDLPADHILYRALSINNGRTLAELLQNVETPDGATKSGVISYVEDFTLENVSFILNAGEDNIVTKVLTNAVRAQKKIGEIINGDDGIKDLVNDVTFGEVDELLPFGEDNVIHKLLAIKRDTLLGDVLAENGIQEFLDGFYFYEVQKVLGWDAGSIQGRFLLQNLEQTVGALLKDDENGNKGIINFMENLSFDKINKILAFGEDNMITKILNIDNEGAWNVKRILEGEALDFVYGIDCADVKNIISATGLTARLLDLTPDLTIGEVISEEGSIDNYLEKIKLGNVPGVLYGYDENGDLAKNNMITRALLLDGLKGLTVKSIIEDTGVNTLLKGVTFDDVAYVLSQTQDNFIGRALIGHVNITVYDAINDLDRVLKEYKVSDAATVIYGRNLDGTLKKNTIIGRALEVDVSLYSVFGEGGSLDNLFEKYTLDSVAKILDYGNDNIIGRALLGHNLTIKDVLGDVTTLEKEYTLDDVAKIMSYDPETGALKDDIIARAFAGKEITVYSVLNDGLDALLDSYEFGEIAGILKIAPDTIPGRALDNEKLRHTKIKTLLQDGGIDIILDAYTLDSAARILFTEDGGVKDSIVTRALLGREISFKSIINDGVDGLLKMYAVKDVPEILYGRNPDGTLKKDTYISRALDIVSADLTFADILGDGGSIDNILKQYKVGDVAYILDVDADNIIARIALTESITNIRIDELLKNETLEDGSTKSGVISAIEKVKLGEISVIINAGADNPITKALTYNEERANTTVGDVIANKDGIKDLVSGITFAEIDGYLGFTEGPVHELLMILIANDDGTDGTHSPTLGEILVGKNGIQHFLDRVTLEHVDKILNLTGVGERIFEVLPKTLTVGGMLTNGFSDVTSNLTFGDVAYVLNYGEDSVLGRALLAANVRDLTVSDVIFGNLTEVLDKYKLTDVAYILRYDAKTGELPNDMITRALNKDISLKQIVDGGVDFVLQEYKLLDVATIIGAGNDSIIGRALNDEEAKRISIYDIYKNGFDGLLNAYTLDDVAKILYTDNGAVLDNYVTRALLGKTMTVKQIADGDTDALLNLFDLGDVPAILYGTGADGKVNKDNYITRALAYAKGITVKDLLDNGGIETLLGKYTLDDVASVLGLDENNIIGRALIGHRLVVSDILLKDGMNKLFGEYVFDDVAYIAFYDADTGTVRDNMFTKALKLHGDINVYDVINDVNVVLKAYTTQDVADILELSEDHMVSRALRLNDVVSLYDLLTYEEMEDGTKKSGLIKYIEAFKLKDIATILYGDEVPKNIITNFLAAHETATVGDYLKDGGLKAELGDFTFDEVANILELGETNIVTRFLRQHPTLKVSDVWAEKGIETLLTYVTMQNVSDLLDLGEDSIVTKLLKTIDATAYDVFVAENGIQNVLDSYKVEKLLGVLDGPISKDNVIYKAVEKLAERNDGLTVGNLLEVVNGEVGVYTYAKKLTLSDVGVDLSSYALYNVLLVNEDAAGVRKELTIGEIIDKNEDGELGIVTKALDTQLSRFKDVFVKDDNFLNKLLAESAGFSVRQVITSDGLKDYAKSFNLNSVANILDVKTGMAGKALATFGEWNVGDLLFTDGAVKGKIDAVTFGQIKSILYDIDSEDLIAKALGEYRATTIGEITAKDGIKTFLKGVTLENVGNIIGEQGGMFDRIVDNFKTWNVGDLLFTDGTLRGYLGATTFADLQKVIFEEGTNNVATKILSVTPDQTVIDIIDGKIQEYFDKWTFASVNTVIDLGDANIITRLLKADSDYVVGDLLLTIDDVDGITRYLDKLTFAKVKTVLDRKTDDIIVRLLDVTPAQSVGSLIKNGGISDYLDKMSFGQLNRVFALGEDHLITKLLNETRTQMVGSLLKEGGVRTYLSGLTLANVKNVTGLNTGIIGRAFDTFATWNLDKLINEDGGAKAYIDAITLNELGAVVFKPEDDNLATKFIKEVGDFTMARLLAKDGIQDLCNQVTFSTLSKVIQPKEGVLSRMLDEFSTWNVGDLLFTKNAISDKLKTVELQTLPKLLYAEDKDNLVTRLLNGKTMTVGEIIDDKDGFEKLCREYTLAELPAIFNVPEGIVTRALEERTDVTVADVIKKDGVQNLLDKYTLEKVSYIAFGENYQNSIFARAFEGDDTTLKQIASETGIKDYLKGYSFNRVANVLNLGESNIVTELLRSLEITGMTVGQVLENKGVKELCDKYEISNLATILANHTGTTSVAYKLLDKLGRHNISEMLKTTSSGTIGAYEIAKAELTLSDLGLDLVKYALFEKILVNDGAELTIGEIINKNADGEFKIVDRVKSMKLNDFVGTIVADKDSVINKILKADKAITVGQILDTKPQEWTNEDGTVVTETGILHLAKSLKLSDVGLDLSEYKLFNVVLKDGENEMSIGEIIKQNEKGELGIVTKVKAMNIVDFYKVIFADDGNIVNKILKKGSLSTNYTIGNLLDSEKKFDWNDDGENYSETALGHLLKSLTLDELGVLGAEDGDLLLYKVTHTAAGDALSIRKLIEKDANGDLGVIANVKDLNLDQLGLAKADGTDLLSKIANKGNNKYYTVRELIDTKAKYVWDAEGNKTLVTEGGETIMNHVFMGLTLSGDLGLDLGAEDSLLVKLTHKTNAAGVRYELTIGELKDTVDERTLGEVVPATAIPAYLAGILDLTFANLMDTKKYVWDADGNKTEDPNGETHVTHVINEIRVSDITGDSDNAVIGALGALKVGELDDNNKVQAEINKIELVELLGAESKNQGTLMYKISHDATGNKITVAGITDRVNALTISDVVDTTGSKVLQYLGNTKINDLAGKVTDMTIGDVVEVGDNKVLQYLGDKKITELSTAIDAMKIDDIVDTTSSPILKSMKDLTINDLGDSAKVQNAINNVAIKDVIDVSGNKLLQAISKDGAADVTIGGISDRINRLTVGELVPAGDNVVVNAIRNVTIDELCNSNKLSETIDGISLNDVMGIDASTTGVLKAFSGMKVGDLKDNDKVKNSINNMPAAEVLGGDAQVVGTIMYKITHVGGADVTIGGLNDRVATLTVDELIDPTSKVGKLLTGKKLSEIETFNFDNVKLSDIMDVNASDVILTKLKDTELKNMEAGIKNLTLEDVMGADLNDCTILDALKTSKLSTLSADINNLPIETALGITLFTENAADTDNANVKFVKNPDGTYTFDKTNGTYYLTKGHGMWLMVLYDCDKTSGNYVYTKVDVTVKTASQRMSEEVSTLGSRTLYELYLYNFIDTEPNDRIKDITLNQLIRDMNNPTNP